MAGEGVNGDWALDLDMAGYADGGFEQEVGMLFTEEERAEIDREAV